MHLLHPYVSVSLSIGGTREVVRVPGGSCESLRCGCWEQNSGPLQAACAVNHKPLLFSPIKKKKKKKKATAKQPFLAPPF